MKPVAFDYASPVALTDALSLLALPGAKPLAGGQSLSPMMNLRLVRPSTLVDVKGLPGLRGAEEAADHIRFGAATTHAEIEDGVVPDGTNGLMPHVAHGIAYRAVRNRGTLGGSLAHADPAAELPVIALALDAQLRAQSATGERWLPAHEFFLGLLTTALTPEEMLVEVALPPLPPRTGTAFLEFARRRGDYALLGVAVVVTLGPADVCTAARLVYLNAGDGPLAAPAAAAMLVGQALTPGAFIAAAEHAAQHEIAPMGNVHATPEYQRHLACVLTRRALTSALDRARQSAVGSPA